MVLHILPDLGVFFAIVVFLKEVKNIHIWMTTTGLKLTTTYYVNEHSNISPNWPVSLNLWVFIYEVPRCDFESPAIT